MKEKVLITGGSGLIGIPLTELLIRNGYEVVHLTREKNSRCGVRTYLWDSRKDFIEAGALEGTDHIIHLAGSSIAGGRWTEERKNSILESRTKTAEFLFKKVKEKNIRLRTFISASGISIYGTRTVEQIFNEEFSPDANMLREDFAVRVVFDWEKSADLFGEICRVVKIRTGIVLDSCGGALQKMYAPVEWGIGSALGTGRQFVPWIHIDDICRMYLFALQNPVSGSYNAVASEHCTNEQLIKLLGKVSGHWVWMPKVPVFLLKFLFGEMAGIVLNGSRVSNEKIRNEGFVFKYEELKPALESFF